MLVLLAKAFQIRLLPPPLQGYVQAHESLEEKAIWEGEGMSDKKNRNKVEVLGAPLEVMLTLPGGIFPEMVL